MKRISVVFLLALCLTGYPQPSSFSPRGVGGGGSLYFPKINPDNDNEFYVGCDMSGLYHTTDFGLSYAMMNFKQIQGGHNALVQFTNNSNILYCISYANDQALPVKKPNVAPSHLDSA